MKFLVAEMCKSYEIYWVKKTVHVVETHYLSDKEKVSKEGHADSYAGH